LGGQQIGNPLPDPRGNVTQRARVIRDYVAQYPDPIRVRAGEVVHIGREDDEYPGWWWCTNRAGHSGWMPSELLRPSGVDGEVLEDYEATELTVCAGDVVWVTCCRYDWMWVRSASGATGWIPASHVVFE
jgi:hypothetical protein